MYLKQQYGIFNLKIFKIPALIRAYSKLRAFHPHEVSYSSFISIQMFSVLTVCVTSYHITAYMLVFNTIEALSGITSRSATNTSTENCVL